MKTPAFKLRFPSGEWATLNTDASAEGLPPGTVVINLVASQIALLEMERDRLREEIRRLGHYVVLESPPQSLPPQG